MAVYTTPPVMTFGPLKSLSPGVLYSVWASKKLSPGVLYSEGVIFQYNNILVMKWMVLLVFYKAYHLGGVLYVGVVYNV